PEIRSARIGQPPAGKHRLHGPRHELLQWIALVRHPNAAHRHDDRAMARRDDAKLPGLYDATGRLDSLERTGTVAPDPGGLTVLDDVDAKRTGGARVAPRDGVMPGRAAPPLHGGTEHRVAHVGGSRC